MNLNNNSSKYRKISAEQLSQSNSRIIIGGLADSELKGLLTKEQILQQRYAEAAAEAETYTQKLISDAQEKVKTMFKAAEQEKETLFEQTKALAYEEGYQKGQQQAKEDISSDISNSLETLNKINQEIADYKKTIFNHQEEALVELCVFIIDKLSAKNLSEDKTMLARIKKALTAIDLDSQLNIYLAPARKKELEAKLTEYLSDSYSLEKLKIIAKSDLQNEDVLIENEKQCFDLSLKSQIENVLEALQDEICKPRSTQNSFKVNSKPTSKKKTLDQCNINEDQAHHSKSSEEVDSDNEHEELNKQNIEEVNSGYEDDSKTLREPIIEKNTIPEKAQEHANKTLTEDQQNNETKQVAKNSTGQKFSSGDFENLFDGV